VRLTPKEKIEDEGNTWWFEKYILSVLFGGLYRRGEWKKRDKKAKRVVSRFGPVFEDARGVPVHKKYIKLNQSFPHFRVLQFKCEINRGRVW